MGWIDAISFVTEKNSIQRQKCLKIDPKTHTNELICATPYLRELFLISRKDSRWVLQLSIIRIILYSKRNGGALVNTVGERLKILREGMGLSQKKMAELLDVTQPSINRYEHGKAVPIEVLIGYADYFDVSMDYITCRCDEPQGKLYQARPPISDNPELGKFIEMCFDPQSPMNERLKETLFRMMEGGK